MICPKCKQQIPNNTINCPHCNTKIGTICKTCGAYNLVYNKSCIECGTELVKFCPNCKSANFPHAQKCRKCGYYFKKSEQNANKNQFIEKPRQFVLPDALRQKRVQKVNYSNLPIQKAPPNQYNQPTQQNVDQFAINLNQLLKDGLPIIPEKDVLYNSEQILSKRISNKKATDINKNVKKKKIIKKIKKRQPLSAENSLKLQQQLNALQSQLINLQQQLTTLPQQLTSINHSNVENSTSNELENKITDNQSVTENNANNIVKENEILATENILKNNNQNTQNNSLDIDNEIKTIKQNVNNNFPGSAIVQDKYQNPTKDNKPSQNLEYIDKPELKIINSADKQKHSNSFLEYFTKNKSAQKKVNFKNLKEKTNQKSVLPKSKDAMAKEILNNHNSRTSRQTLKGILPLKKNDLPNHRNLTDKIQKFQMPDKNTLSEASLKKISELSKDNNQDQAEIINQNDIQAKTQFVYSPNLFTQQSAKDLLVNTLLNTSVSIISLSGESGIGKNIVIKSIIEELKDNQFVWLIGKSTPQTQITPCGLFQDILLSFFNIPNYCINTQKLRSESSKFFKTEFSSLKNEEIDDLINFLYPEKVAYYENIFKNKAKTFNLLRKVFDVITSRTQTVFVLDNFEHIDNMSYEFLKTLINAKSGLMNTKFILTYNEPKSARTYLYDKTLTNDSYVDVSLVPFNKVQTETFINQYNPLFIGASRDLINAVYNQTKGNPAYIEQILNLATDSSRNYISFSLPDSFEQVVKRRLEILKHENSHVYELLIASAILGQNFYPVILNQLFKIDNKSFIALFSSLLDLNYITPISESAYEFKNTKLWKTILEIARKDRNFMKINEKLFVILSEFTLSSHSSLALIATTLKENLSALNIWTDVIKQASAIGDENIYILAQKYSLLIVEKLQGMNRSLIKNNIYERLGKVMSFSNPKAAVEYLPKVIENARRLDDNLKEFELVGYLAKCCYEIRNHFGVIECIDNAVANIDPSYDLEIAMVKSRKINSLLTIGNFGEVVDLIENEILPIFEENLDTTKVHKNIKIEDLFESWIQTYLALANALVLQGDNRSISIISTIFEIFEKNKIYNSLYICKTKLTLALANTLKGYVAESEKILDDVLHQYKNNDIMDVQAITVWNIISVLNCIFRNKLDGLQDELFQIVTFVNNNNDIYSKNLLKLLLGKVLKEKGKFKQALTIYSEELAYFAKEKNALGVLASWYFISEVILLTAGPEKSLEYSLIALDIAQSQKIKNYYFIVQLNKIIGEAYLALQDYDTSKVYIESAIGIARQFDLYDALSELYYLYGKYLQEIATIKSDSQQNYASSALKMFDKAILLAQKLKNNVLATTVMTSVNELRTYCQEHGIILR